MPLLQELFRNLEEPKIELRSFTKNDDDKKKKKKSLSLKATTSFEINENHPETLEDLDMDEELTLLTKKY